MTARLPTVANSEVKGALLQSLGTSRHFPIVISDDRTTQPSVKSNIKSCKSFAITYHVSPCDLKCCTGRLIPALNSLRLFQAKYKTLLESSRRLHSRLQNLLESESSIDLALDDSPTDFTSSDSQMSTSSDAGSYPPSPRTIPTQSAETTVAHPSDMNAKTTLHGSSIFPFTFSMGTTVPMSSVLRPFNPPDKFVPTGYSRNIPGLTLPPVKLAESPPQRNYIPLPTQSVSSIPSSQQPLSSPIETTSSSSSCVFLPSICHARRRASQAIPTDRPIGLDPSNATTSLLPLESPRNMSPNIDAVFLPQYHTTHDPSTPERPQNVSFIARIFNSCRRVGSLISNWAGNLLAKLSEIRLSRAPSP